MSIFTISDLHLALDNKEKSMEIFKGWNNYVNNIKNNWTKVVKPEDTVVIIGDISWAMKLEETKRDFQFIENLPGKKILIKGNHDYWWESTSKINNFLKDNNFQSISIIHNSAIEVEDYAICGTRGWMFKSITPQDKKVLLREIGRLKTSIEIAKSKELEPLVFLHYPPIYGFEESEEIINILIEKQIKRCYYGHIHSNNFSGGNKKILEGNYKGINFKLVSCDYINFCPLKIS